MLSSSALAADSYIGVSSDIHGNTANVSSWLSGNSGNQLDYMVFGGDNADFWSSSTITTIKNIFSTSYPNATPIFTMGNHDWMQSTEATGETAFLAATGNTRTGIQNDPDADGYTIYTFGVASASYAFASADIADLLDALEAADETQPFFIISHYPLHYSESRAITNASQVITLLNNYPNTFFFWGHNHHAPDSMLGAIKVAGETITAADTQTSVQLNFTYCNSGHMGTGNGTADADGTGVVVGISDDGSTTTVDLSFNEKDGTVLTTESVTLEDDPSSTVIDSVAVAGITAPVAGRTPDTTATVPSSSYSAVAVTWNPSDSAFTEETIYLASVTLTANGDRIFAEADNITATVNGNAATSVILNEDGTLTVTYQFPATSTLSGSSDYELASQIEDGETYLIVAQSGSTYYALTTTSFASGSTDYLQGAQVTVDGDYVEASGVTDGMLWTFTTDGDGYDVTNDDNYLNRRSSQSNGGIYTSTTEGDAPYSDWIHDSSSDYLYTYSTAGSTNFYLYLTSSGSTYYFDTSSSTSSINRTIYLYKMIEGRSEEDLPITNAAITDITAPVTGAIPGTSATTSDTAYTVGTVSWSPSAGAFAAGTVYTASVTLTPASGYVFTFEYGNDQRSNRHQ